NHPEAHVFAGTIQDWLATEEVPDADLVVGGPPCQGFSALGKQDATDERNSMCRHYAETVARARPRYFVMENVPQFLTSPEYT
ncbi:DNA cytosine methyltransferase, partial [Enterobacter asburiae]|uniref:DNA cytosine methyltransferase n=1 Tax=Enterobacter asburiae TaxID=61645 RepID=UPI00402AACC3